MLPYRIEPVAVERAGLGAFLLSEKRPLVFNVMWYFAAADAHGDLRLPTPAEVAACAANGAGCGGHVILLTGYDSASRRFSFRNSWGPSWGDQGYGTIPERYLVEQCEVCAALAHPESLSPDDLAFAKQASQGVSGRITGR